MEKMKIFVSWSGPRSAAVAEALKEYLPMINNAFELWLSSDDIAKGSRSTLEIAKALVAARAGIICLTPNNLTAPWILFEAGGIAKTVDQALACTVLIDLQPSDVSKPLGEFQHTRLNEKELLKLVIDLNAAAGESARKDTDIQKAFNLCWPELSERLKNLPSDGSTKRPERDPQEMLEELTDLARQTSLGVLESHRRISEKIGRLESMQAYANSMIPALGPSWYETASEVLGGADASDKGFTAAMRPPPGKRFQQTSKNALRDYVMEPPPTPDDDPERK